MGGAAALVALLLVALCVTPLRERLLAFALSRAASALPGDLQVGEAHWPALGTLQLRGVRWTDGTTTLVAAAEISVALALPALVQRDLEIRALTLLHGWADVPALSARFAKPGKSTTPSAWRPRFPRRGAVPGLPSLVVHSLDVQADSLRLRPEHLVTGIVVTGSMEARRAHVPWIRLENTSARSPTAGWELTTLALDVDLERGSARGSGRGQLQPHWPVFFALEPDGVDRFVLRLSDTEGAFPPARPGISATLDVVRRQGDVEALAWNATVRVPGTVELARIPALAARLQHFPTLAGLTCVTNGRLTLRPQPGFELEVQVQPDSLLRAGRFTIAGDADAWQVDCEELQLADLRLSGLLRSAPDSLVTAVAIDVQGNHGLAALGLAGLPELRLQGRGQARLHRATGAASIGVDARGKIAGQSVERLQLLGNLGLHPPTQAAITLQLEHRGLQAGFAAAIMMSDTLHARLGPLLVTTRLDATTLAVPARDAATLRYDPRQRELQLHGLRLRGELGDADMTLYRDRAGNGRFDAHIAWPAAPALLQRFFAAGDSRLDSLRSRWEDDAPYALDVAGTFAPTGGVSLTGSFVLPGPRTLAAFLPARLRSETLGPLAGSVQLEIEPGAGGRVLRVELDAARTEWLDVLHVRAASDGATHHVEQAECAIAGTRLSLSGTLSAPQCALRLQLDMPDSALVLRLLRTPIVPGLRLRGEATLAGPLERPSIEATLAGRLAVAGCRIPAVHAALQRDSTATRLQVELPEGAASAWMRLDSLQALVTTGPRVFPAVLSLRAHGPDMELQQESQVVADSLWSVHVETLRFVLGGKDLQARTPFQVRGGGGRLHLDALELAGELGRVEARGLAGADSTRLTAHVDLALPEKPALLAFSADLWPRRLRLDLDAPSSTVLRAEAELQGFRLAGGARPGLRVDVHADDEHVRVAATLAECSVTYLEGEAEAPLRLRLVPPLVQLGAGDMTASARFAALPLALRKRPKSSPRAAESLAHLGGSLFLRGTTSVLSGYAAARVTAPETPLWIELHARTGADAHVDSLWNAADIATLPPAADACTAVFQLGDPNGTLLHGSAIYPGSLSLAPPAWRTATGTVAARLRAEALPLAHLNPYLHGATLAGSIALDAGVDGAVHNPSLSGGARSTGVELTLSDGSRIVLDAALQMSGDKERPRLGGEIEVKSGLIKVPELPKNLHPTTGEALLRSGAAVTPSPGDALGVAAPAATAPGGERKAPAGPGELARTEVDIGVRIPGAFSVRGRGLDLELAGELRLQQSHGLPGAVGELRVVRGTYSLLGRTCNLVRGVVTFFGDQSMRPRLDIQLSTQVAGTKIRVFLSGTTEKPEITLSSDPEMEQTDIVTLLAVGKTFDQVSDEESSLLRERATAVLLSVGAAALQENVSTQLGIDVVQYRSTGGAPTGDDAQGTRGSLAFGKYLSPRLLLSYSYALDRATDDLVSVEYFLRGDLRLETLYSAGGQTGLGFGWTREY